MPDAQRAQRHRSKCGRHGNPHELRPRQVRVCARPGRPVSGRTFSCRSTTSQALSLLAKREWYGDAQRIPAVHLREDMFSVVHLVRGPPCPRSAVTVRSRALSLAPLAPAGGEGCVRLGFG